MSKEIEIGKGDRCYQEFAAGVAENAQVLGVDKSARLRSGRTDLAKGRRDVTSSYVSTHRYHPSEPVLEKKVVPRAGAFLK
jgi:hypothetical protein